MPFKGHFFFKGSWKLCVPQSSHHVQAEPFNKEKCWRRRIQRRPIRIPPASLHHPVFKVPLIFELGIVRPISMLDTLQATHGTRLEARNYPAAPLHCMTRWSCKLHSITCHDYAYIHKLFHGCTHQTQRVPGPK